MGYDGKKHVIAYRISPPISPSLHNHTNQLYPGTIMQIYIYVGMLHSAVTISLVVVLYACGIWGVRSRYTIRRRMGYQQQKNNGYLV